MKNKIALYFSFSFFVSFTALRSQDIHFAQLAETPQLINPSLTGLYDGFYRGIINYRNQWPAMGKPYSTFMASFDAPLAMKKKDGGYLGLGAFLYSDKAGDSRFGTTQANVSVASILPAGETSKFSMGLQFGYVQKSLSLSDIQWPNQYNGYQYDPNITPNEQLNKNSFSYFDIGAGFNYSTYRFSHTIDGKNTDKFEIGASFFHSTFPLQKFSPASKERLYPKIIAHTSIRHDFPGTKLGIVPSAVVIVQGPAFEVNAGALLRYKIHEGTKVTGFYTESAFSGGIHYRFKDAISPQIYFEFSDYAFGISYDFNVSSFGQVKKSAGGLELSIKYANMRGAVRKGIH